MKKEYLCFFFSLLPRRQLQDHMELICLTVTRISFLDRMGLIKPRLLKGQLCRPTRMLCDSRASGKTRRAGDVSLKPGEDRACRRWFRAQPGRQQQCLCVSSFPSFLVGWVMCVSLSGFRRQNCVMDKAPSLTPRRVRLDSLLYPIETED